MSRRYWGCLLAVLTAEAWAIVASVAWLMSEHLYALVFAIASALNLAAAAVWFRRG